MHLQFVHVTEHSEH
ncbi:rCG46285 [Rattus norvegicus]|uniref:RCG46285 n=1 Tax=Rattus norvegicus TaxID=10116 RepID=A6ID35_RAT|nr:rCG46285 [Rattus norvegicus]